MFGILYANWYIASCVALILIVATYAIISVWRDYKFRSNGRHAIKRLRKLDRGEPIQSERIINPALSLQIETNVQAVFEYGEMPEPKLPMIPGLPPPVETSVEPVFEREELPEPELAVTPRLPLPVGTKVQAVRNFGLVRKGTPGIVTGVVDLPFFWSSRAAYRCTFSNNIKADARSNQIEAHDHGYNLVELEQANFASILSRQMVLRAQQLFSRQHAMRPFIPAPDASV
jgi:hypothetical protein